MARYKVKPILWSSRHKRCDGKAGLFKISISESRRGGYFFWGEGIPDSQRFKTLDEAKNGAQELHERAILQCIE